MRRAWPVLAAVGAALAGVSDSAIPICLPFTDVPADAFCPLIQEIFYLGITTGTTPTTFDPSSPVSRVQMAAFLSRSVDGTLRRGSPRAPLQRFWTPQYAAAVGLTTIGADPLLCQSDGGDVWVGNYLGDTVSRVRGTDGKLLETWTGAASAYGVLSAMSRILVTAELSPGRLYSIDPARPAGAVTTVASTLGNLSRGLAFDGGQIWTANGNGTVSIVTPSGAPWTVTTVTVSATPLIGAVFDGSNIWVTSVDFPGKLVKLDPAGAILQTVTVGNTPEFPAFDGTNIWVPNANSNSVSVVRASSGAVLATLTGGLMNSPVSAAFDGERILITSFGNDSVSLWKAANLTLISPPIALSASSGPSGACSDAISFWIALSGSGKLARF